MATSSSGAPFMLYFKQENDEIDDVVAIPEEDGKLDLSYFSAYYASHTVKLNGIASLLKPDFSTKYDGTRLQLIVEREGPRGTTKQEPIIVGGRPAVAAAVAAAAAGEQGAGEGVGATAQGEHAVESQSLNYRWAQPADPKKAARLGVKKVMVKTKDKMIKVSKAEGLAQFFPWLAEPSVYVISGGGTECQVDEDGDSGWGYIDLDRLGNAGQMADTPLLVSGQGTCILG